MFANASKNFMVPFDSRRSYCRGRADHLRRAAGLLNLFQADFEKWCASTVILRVNWPVPSIFSPAPSFFTTPSSAEAGRHREHVAFQLFQLAQVDDGELLLEDVGETALGQAAMQRHLAAFETALLAETGAGALAFGAARGGLAVSRAHAAADALARLLSGGGL
jgi:hypothetical protein